MARKHRRDRGLFPYRLAGGTICYGVRVWRHGRPRTWKGFRSKTEARTFYEDRRRDIREGRPFPDEVPTTASVTVAELIDPFLDDPLVRRKKSYTGDLQYAAFWKRTLGPKRVTSVSTVEIDRARTNLLRHGRDREHKPVSPATVNRYVAWLHHVYNWGIDREMVTKNPCRLFVRSVRKGGQRFPEKPAPEQVWSNAEMELLEQQLGDQLLVPLLALLSGLRQGEQFPLRKDRVNLDTGVGYLDDPKAGRAQVVYFNADAVKILRYWAARSGESPFFLPSPRWPLDRPMSGKHWYTAVFKPAAARAGLIVGRQHGKTWHTLRHSFADRLLDLKVHLKDVQDAGRWESWQAMRRYLRRRQDRVEAGVRLLKSPIPLRRLIGTDTKPTLVRKRPRQPTVTH